MSMMDDLALDDEKERRRREKERQAQLAAIGMLQAEPEIADYQEPDPSEVRASRVAQDVAHVRGGATPDGFPEGRSVDAEEASARIRAQSGMTGFSPEQVGGAIDRFMGALGAEDYAPHARAGAAAIGLTDQQGGMQWSPEGLAGGIGEGATYGWGDEAVSAARAGMGDGEGESFSARYDDLVTRARARQRTTREEAPGSYMGGEFAGATGPALMLPAASTVRGMIAQGFLEGSIGTMGLSEGDITEMSTWLEGLAGGAAGGAMAGVMGRLLQGPSAAAAERGELRQAGSAMRRARRADIRETMPGPAGSIQGGIQAVGDTASNLWERFAPTALLRKRYGDLAELMRARARRTGIEQRVGTLNDGARRVVSAMDELDRLTHAALRGDEGRIAAKPRVLRDMIDMDPPPDPVRAMGQAGDLFDDVEQALSDFLGDPTSVRLGINPPDTGFRRAFNDLKNAMYAPRTRPEQQSRAIVPAFRAAIAEGDVAEAFVQLDSLKRAIGQAQGRLSGADSQRLRGLYMGLRDALENHELWGTMAADFQAGTNHMFTELIDAEQGYRPLMGERRVTDRMAGSPGQGSFERPRRARFKAVQGALSSPDPREPAWLTRGADAQAEAFATHQAYYEELPAFHEQRAASEEGIAASEWFGGAEGGIPSEALDMPPGGMGSPVRPGTEYQRAPEMDMEPVGRTLPGRDGGPPLPPSMVAESPDVAAQGYGLPPETVDATMVAEGPPPLPGAAPAVSTAPEVVAPEAVELGAQQAVVRGRPPTQVVPESQIAMGEYGAPLPPDAPRADPTSVRAGGRTARAGEPRYLSPPELEAMAAPRGLRRALSRVDVSQLPTSEEVRRARELAESIRSQTDELRKLVDAQEAVSRITASLPAEQRVAGEMSEVDARLGGQWLVDQLESGNASRALRAAVLIIRAGRPVGVPPAPAVDVAPEADMMEDGGDLFEGFPGADEGAIDETPTDDLFEGFPGA